MKKGYSFLLLGLGILGWVMYIYQARQNDLLVKKVEDSVLGEVDFRFKTEQRIKSEMETRRKDREFLDRREAEREFEDSIKQKIIDLESGNEKDLEQISKVFNQGIAGLENKLSKLENEINNSSQKLVQIEAGFYSGLKEAKDANQLQVSVIKDGLDKYGQELSIYKQQLQVLFEKVTVQQNLINENAHIMSEQKKQIQKLQEHNSGAVSP
jgi:hypothetical protein